MCLIACFYIFNVSNDPSLYIMKKKFSKVFDKNVITFSQKNVKNIILKVSQVILSDYKFILRNL